PDLHRPALTIGASRFFARSPRSTLPQIRFLYIGPRFRFPLPSHSRSPFCGCGSLRSGWSPFGGTFTRKTAPMLGAQTGRRSAVTQGGTTESNDLSSPPPVAVSRNGLLGGAVFNDAFPTGRWDPSRERPTRKQ